tara:strand:+ start:1039 stop:2103 length:1065 start_codon:yes stop_codon:yes gene_type:complete
MNTKVFKSNFSKTLLGWYNVEKRKLPFRESKDPYKVWLSEIILQQTQMKTGVKYYKRFIKRFPSVNKLAEAEQKELYSLWEGLGYYNRALNLHKTAKIITEEYCGVFPKTYDELIKLPGVGKYTASAISSICYNEKRVVVDANVFRVLARIFNIKTNISKPQAYNSFLDLSNNLAKKTINTGDYNEAIMDFGSTVCSPKKPACYKCVFNSSCEANSKGMVDLLPVKSTKKKTVKRDFNYYVFENKKNLLIRKRTNSDIWKNLYEFHLEEGLKENKKIKEIKKELESQNVKVTVTKDKGLLSHQKINVVFNHFKIPDNSMFKKIKKGLELIKVHKNKINEYGFPKVIVNYLNSSR